MMQMTEPNSYVSWWLVIGSNDGRVRQELMTRDQMLDRHRMHINATNPIIEVGDSSYAYAHVWETLEPEWFAEDFEHFLTKHVEYRLPEDIWLELETQDWTIERGNLVLSDGVSAWVFCPQDNRRKENDDEI